MSKIIFQYLERVVAQDKDTWFNIHHRVVHGNGREDTYPGSAHQTLRTAWLDAMYWMNKGCDVYLAQGAYLNAGEHYAKKPYPSALRYNSNLTSCRSLYMDVDVKPGAYSSTSEAKQALLKFVSDKKLPLPTIIVESGSGGLHVYWTLTELIVPKEFEKLAGQLVSAAIQQGVHFDPQCTNDSVRLLRVADTWNFKGEPKPVNLIWDSKVDVNADEMRNALAPYPVYVTSKKHPRAPTAPDDPNDDMALPKSNYPTPTIDTVALDCPFIKDALDNGGAGLSEPHWKHTISIACHTATPEEDAHRLSKGHEKYSVEETDNKLATAQQAREQRGIGPPRCEVIARDGVPQCRTCPYLKLATTPLLVRMKKFNQNTPNFVGSVRANNKNDPDLPIGYWRGTDGLIHGEMFKADGGQEDIVAFEYPILPNSGYVEKSFPYKLVFETMQAGKQSTKTFETGVTSDQFMLGRALANEALPLTGEGAKHTREFMANYLKLLQDRGSTFITSPAFGWSQDGEGNWGFAYAGEFVSKSGTYKCTRAGEGGELYGVIGDVAAWRALADIVLTPDRPDLCMMAAASFGAPLIRMSGQDGLLNGIWSSRSGIGKTTALKLNQAVWSMPTLGGLTDTVNYTFAKCALLRHLPVNYDEIKGAKQIENMVDVVFQLTGGGERGRADRSGNAKIKREFQTNINYASNASIIGPVRESQLGTDASWLRMMEFRGISDGYNLTHNVAAVGRMTQDLRQNYGGNGRKYAAFIGANHTKVHSEYVKFHDAVTAKLQPAQEERFWMSAIATTLFGARIANYLGIANFPLSEMYDFAVGEYRFLQKEMMSNSSDFGKDMALVSTIGALLNEKRERNMVVLDKTWYQRGRPTKGYAKVMNEHQGKQWLRIDVQISGEPITLRVSDSALNEWCARTKRPKSALCHALQDKLGAKLVGVVLGSGSHKAGSRENCWIIEPMNTVLEPAVEEYVTQYGLLP